MRCERCGGSGVLETFHDAYSGGKCQDCRGTGTKPEPDCINPDCVGGWMTEHEDLTELTIPCSRCNADRHKAKPFFAPKVIVHPRQPEPEQDERIREALYKDPISRACYEYGFQEGVASRNAEIEALKAKAYIMTESARKNLKEMLEYRNDVDLLKADLKSYTRKAEKWDMLAVELQCTDRGQYYNDMISAITAKINAEVIPLKAEIESMRSQIKTVRQILTGVKSNMWEETINEAVRQLDKEK